MKNTFKSLVELEFTNNCYYNFIYSRIIKIIKYIYIYIHIYTYVIYYIYIIYIYILYIQFINNVQR